MILLLHLLRSLAAGAGLLLRLPRPFLLPRPSFGADVKSWHLLCLLAAAHYGNAFFGEARWHVFVAMLGLLSAYLLWHARGPRWSVMWAVCCWGAFEGLEVFTCQLAGIWTGAHTGPFEGMCDAQTGLPFTTFGLLLMAVCATLWIERHAGTARR